MESIFQDPRDLILGITMDDTPVNGLTVLQESSITHDSYEITFRIIGESHWVTISHSGRVVCQEVLACVRLEGVSWTHEYNFKEETTHRLISDGYAVSVGLENFREEFHKLGTDAEHLSLYFPDPFGGNFLPFTRVWWIRDADVLRWWTLHVYAQPTQPVVVVSSSRFSLAGGEGTI